MEGDQTKNLAFPSRCFIWGVCVLFFFVFLLFGLHYCLGTIASFCVCFQAVKAIVETCITFQKCV